MLYEAQLAFHLVHQFAGVIIFSGMANVVKAQKGSIFPKEDVERARNAASQRIAPGAVLGCTGPITRVIDVVSLTFLPPTNPPLTTPRHMVGHFERPFGISSPAVFMDPESVADMFAANFFQKVGSGPHEVRPGTYKVDVWWSGDSAPPGPGGAVGAAFVLKLYLR